MNFLSRHEYSIIVLIPDDLMGGITDFEGTNFFEFQGVNNTYKGSTRFARTAGNHMPSMTVLYNLAFANVHF